MKRILMPVLLFLMVVFVYLPAYAAEYEVRKGDSLWSISQKFDVSMNVLWHVNKEQIEDKKIIHPGQKLQIPDDYFGYLFPNAEPFTLKRDPVKLIKKFDCPEEVKKQFVEFSKDLDYETESIHTVKKGETLWKLELMYGVEAERIYKHNKDVITHPKKWLMPGQELRIPGEVKVEDPVYISPDKGDINHSEQMGFGDYVLKDDVRVLFDDRQKAKQWKVTHEGKNYYLVLPLNCYNWAWHEGREKEKKKKYSVIVFPRFAGDKEVPSGAKPAKMDEGERRWKPSWDGSAYAGHYKGIQSENSDNWHQYVGANISVFPKSYNINNGRYRFGPAAQYLYWQGEAANTVEYDGNLRLLGAEAEYLADNTQLSLLAYGGKKKGWVGGIDFPYSSNEEAKIFVTEASVERWYKKRWFPQQEAGVRLQFAFDEEKQSRLAGEPFDEAPVNQGEYSLRLKTDLYKGDIATPTAEVSTGYREFDRSGFVEPRVGVKWLNDMAATDVSYQAVEHSQNDMAAAHARLELLPTTSRLGKWLMDI